MLPKEAIIKNVPVLLILGLLLLPSRALLRLRQMRFFQVRAIAFGSTPRTRSLQTARCIRIFIRELGACPPFIEVQVSCYILAALQQPESIRLR
ncbi:MAG: hypothetical protein AB1589_17905 [Cyanobacteriota bacterium]